MQPVRVIIILLLAVLPLFASFKFNDAEKKAIRREMVDLDLIVRSISSQISMGYSRELVRTIRYITDYQIKRHPEHGKALNSVKQKWKTLKLERYMRNIHSSSKKIISHLNYRNKRNREPDWSRVNRYLGDVLNNCRACHEKAGVK